MKDDRSRNHLSHVDPSNSCRRIFAHAYGRLAVHIPGPPERLTSVLSWKEFNRLLNQASLWSNHNTTMVLDGHDIRPEEFCRPGTTRHGNAALLPDPARVDEYLQLGATLVLDLMERLSPGVARVGASLEAISGSPVTCNAYCSFHQHQGFSSHFDSTDVFVLHIEGEKTWRLYEGRFDHPLLDDYARLPAEQHTRARGKLLKEVLLTPGDVLYVPRGQYHDAVASSEACLHLTFGLTPRTGCDLFRVLLPALRAEPLFREALPHFDDARAYRSHMCKLGQRLDAILADEQTVTRAREQHRERALRDSLRSFSLPERPGATFYRVRWRYAKPPAGEHTTPREITSWVLARDYFAMEQLAGAFPCFEQEALQAVVAKLVDAGLLERV